MNFWFLCKITYNKELEDGSIKRMRDTYLADAVTFTDAEARMHEEIGQIRDDFEVANVSRVNFADVFTYPNLDTYYKCKIRYTLLDENSGKEKHKNSLILVAAQDVKDAHERLTDELKSMLVPYEITEIVKTPILEIFKYKSPDERITPNLKPLMGIEDEE
ncbi:MAG: DUF4494 domain-containing protein [Bernardetiaceae bacterium]|nr:DUF4494 domain-containing protein [Bernardetiaceae bacterium]